MPFPALPIVSFYDLVSRGETQQQLQALVESLSQQNAALTDELRDATVRHVEAEQTNSDLVKLCIVHERLQGTTLPQEVHAAVDEIVGAVIGCEEFALIGPGDDGGAVCLHVGPLLTGATFDMLPCGHSVLLDALRAPAAPTIGTPVAADAAPAITAVVPFVHEGVVVAVLVLYRMLPQKFAFEPLDHALVDVLARFGGKALRAATLFALVLPPRGAH